MSITNISNFFLFTFIILGFNSCSKLEFSDKNTSIEQINHDVYETDDVIKHDIANYQSKYLDYYSKFNILDWEQSKKINKIKSFNFGNSGKKFSSTISNIIIIKDIAYYVDGKANFIKYDLLNDKLLSKISLDQNINKELILPTSIASFNGEYYVAFGGGKIIKFLEEGAIIWEKNFNDVLRTHVKLLNDKIIIIFNSNKIISIKSKDGDSIWEYSHKLNKPSLSKGGKLITKNNFIFYVMPNGIISSIDLIVGEQAEYDFLTKIIQKNLLNYNYEIKINIFDNILSIIENNETVYSYDLRDEKFILYDEKIYLIKSSLFINNSLLSLNDNLELKAYNLLNKNVFWKTDLSKFLSKEDTLIDSHVLKDNRILVFFSSGKIITLNKLTGEFIFKINLKLKNVNSFKVEEKYLIFYQSNGKAIVFQK